MWEYNAPPAEMEYINSKLQEPLSHLGPWRSLKMTTSGGYLTSWAFITIGTLAFKEQTEAEIREDLEWSLNEYIKAMKVHHMKSSYGLMDVFLVTPIELIKALVKLNWSKIAKGVLSMKKRAVELMEAEMKAPGRECAYVFD